MLQGACAVRSRAIGRAGLLLAAMVTACGGGSESQGGESTAAASSVVATATAASTGAAAAAPPAQPTAGLRVPGLNQLADTQVVIAPSVPVRVRRQLTTFVSTEGEAAPGQRVAVRSSDTGFGSIVVGVDSRGRMRLAAAVTSEVTEFSAESTAVALIRLGLGPDGAEIGHGPILGAIYSSPAFAPLVAEMQRLLEANLAPASSEALARALMAAVSDAAARLGAAAAGRAPAGAARERPLALAPDRVTNPPFDLVTVDLGPIPLTLQLKQLPDSRVEVVNLLPAYFDITTKSLEGGSLSRPAEVEMARYDLAGLAGIALRGGPSVAFDVRGDRPFDLRVRQTETTRVKTWSNLWASAMATLIGPMFPDRGACSVRQLMPVIQTLVEEGYSGGASGPRLLAQDVVKNGPIVSEVVARVSTVCANSATSMGKVVASMAGIYVRFFTLPLTAVQAGGLMAEWAVAGAVWVLDPDRTVGVCRSASRRIVNCAYRFDELEDVALAAPNSFVFPGFKAFDVNDKETAMPTGLVYSGPASPSLSVVDPPTGTAATTAVLGTAQITVFDPATEAAGEVTVRVVRPRLEPAATSMAVGEFRLFTLVDRATGRDLRWISGTQWTVVPPDAGEVGLVLPADPDRAVYFKANKPGPVVLRATNGFRDWQQVAQISVYDPLAPQYGTLNGFAPFRWSTGTCRGTYGFSGGWTLRPAPDDLRFDFDLDEILSTNCFSQTIRYRGSMPLTASPSAEPSGGTDYSGQVVYPFPQGGRLILKVEATLVNGRVQGRFAWDNINTCCNNPAGSVGSTALTQ